MVPHGTTAGRRMLRSGSDPVGAHHLVVFMLDDAPVPHVQAGLVEGGFHPGDLACSTSSTARGTRLVAGQPGQRERACQAVGELTGPNPTDLGKPGSKCHLLTDRRDLPLAVGLSAAHTHDAKLLEAMVNAVAPVKRPAVALVDPGKRPAKLANRAAGAPPVCGGAVAGVAGELSAAAGAPRTACRHAARVPASGLLADLPQLTEHAKGMTMRVDVFMSGRRSGAA